MFKIHDFLRLYRLYIKAGHTKQDANRIAYEIAIMGASF